MKINTNNPKQVGTMGLHIRSVNDMSADKWLNFFDDADTIKFALQDTNSYLSAMPSHHQEMAINLLKSKLQSIETGEAIVIDKKQLSKGKFRESAYQSGGVQGTSQKSSIVTDKGVFHCIKSLKMRLQSIYSIANFDSVFVEAIELSKLPVDVEYISDKAKKVLLSNTKVAIVSSIEKTVDDI